MSMGVLTCLLSLSNYNNAIVDLETGIGPFGSELPENDKSDAEVESGIGPIGNEALEYDNCDSEVITKKKTKR